MQGITIAPQIYAAYRRKPDFIQRYIFPGGMLPTQDIIREQAEAAGLKFECVQTFGHSYALTLAEWRRRFHATWPEIASLSRHPDGAGFDERFRRMWDYYLAYCEAGFTHGTVDVGIFMLSETRPDAAAARGGGGVMPDDMSPNIEGRANTGHGLAVERFELTTFLHGRTRAWGVFEDRFGRLRRRFYVTMTGTWHDNTFVLDEQFLSDDGRIEHRVWHVTPLAEGRFTATCDDCIGEAVGRCTTDSVVMRYRFRLRLPSRVLTVDFLDRLYKINATTAVNRAMVSKWGIKIGELSLFFLKDGIPDRDVTKNLR